MEVGGGARRAAEVGQQETTKPAPPGTEIEGGMRRAEPQRPSSERGRSRGTRRSEAARGGRSWGGGRAAVEGGTDDAGDGARGRCEEGGARRRWGKEEEDRGPRSSDARGRRDGVADGWVPHDGG